MSLIPFKHISFSLGNYCPICFKCYEDNDYDSQMMQCGTCNHWVHAKCEDLTGDCFYLMCLSGLNSSATKTRLVNIHCKPPSVENFLGGGVGASIKKHVLHMFWIASHPSSAGKLLSNNFRRAVRDPVQPARECGVFMSAMQRDSAQCLERAALH